ncbi:DNA-directed DNA polymerase, family A, palm domain containing protein [uncultured Caudovirales phage]|uniref:DNA-directed DNA polymerase, family A, palm domain containing protein n=1 Tax=uncultured Caudovirales phage TaxID=2100421 RepID=A0A6J5MCE2_9CAUD|nr:DNA-directed DNA polymerase, family A, palm domain containing protein [uncultured Caudovirales phage]
MKQSKITIPGVDIVQESLFCSQIPEIKLHQKFPEVKGTELDFLRALDEFDPEFGLGLDYEFDPKTYRPTIIGISTEHYAVSLPASDHLAEVAIDAIFSRKSRFVGYSIFGAEKPIIDRVYGRETVLDIWDDGLRSFYLANAVLCKSPGKEEDEGGSLGFMNLSTASTYYTGIPVYKICRGNLCYGPCPYHRVFEYNGVDAWAGLHVHNAALKDFYSKGGTYDVYRRKIFNGDLCYKKQHQGIHTDRRGIADLDLKIAEKKKSLFAGTDFNPASNIQIINKAKSLGSKIEKSDIKQIQKSCEKELKALGYASIQDFEAIHGEGQEDFDPNFVAQKISKLDGKNVEIAAFFYRLYKYKKSGKGTKSWFDEKYFNSNNLLTPRFNDTGTSLGRLSSSKPNFQNVPRTGFGEEIRKCIIAPDGFDIIKADFSNLELRIILWSAGFDITTILKLDPFQWLVDNSNGLFDSVATKMNTGFSARDWAKSVSHASNLLEGFTLLSEIDLSRPHTQKLIKNGALRIFHDWFFRGKMVAFTGANLAERLLGSKTEANRKAMLDMQWDIYFKSFPILNEFHRKLLKDVENAKVFKIPGGMVLDLYGPDLDDAKIAAAAIGQGGGAAFTQEAEIRFVRGTDMIPFATVHDDLNILFPESCTDEEILDKMKLLVVPSELLPGMICPAKVLRGKNWKESDMKPLGKIY